MRVKLMRSIYFCILTAFIFSSSVFAQDKFIVRVDLGKEQNYRAVEELNLDLVHEGIMREVKIVADQSVLDRLRSSGYNYEILRKL